MANSIVRLPIDYFPDPTKGRPVFNGSVYIGNPDTDPEVLGNRKTVTLRQEDGTEVPITGAGQPLITGAGGVILYNGSPAQVLTNGDYSIKVLNAQGSKVYYVESVNDGSPATIDKVTFKYNTLADAIASTDIYETAALNIAELTAGNGGGAMWDAVLSSTVTENTYNIVQCTGVGTLSLVLRMDAVVNVKSAWATGDGSTVDSTAINAAFVAVTGKTLFFPASTYELGTIKLEIDNPIVVICEQGVVFNQSNNIAMIEIDDTENVTFVGNKCLFQHVRASAGPNTFYIRGSQRVNVENVRFSASPKDQIYVGQSIANPTVQNEDVTVRGCEFDGARRQGISVITCNRFHSEGNVFHDITGESPQAGIDLEADASVVDDGLGVFNSSIIGNKFYDITVQAGVFIATATDVVVMGNNFVNCLVGVSAVGVFANTNEKTISAITNASNQFTIAAHGMKVGSRLYLTEVGGGTVPAGALDNVTYRVDTVVDANTLTLSTYFQSVPLAITDDGTLPLQMREVRDDMLCNITIEGNTFKDCINQSVVTDRATRVIIKGNAVDGGSASTANMLLSHTDESIIEGNTIKNLTSGEGIFCSGIETKVDNNVIVGAEKEGIRFYGGEACSVNGNLLVDCGNTGGEAMDLRYFNNSHILNNRVWDKSGLGISIAINMRGSDSTGNVISGNNLKDSCANNNNSLSQLDRQNTISNTNILDDGETYSAQLRASTSNFQDAAHEVNTGDKYQGKMMYNATTNVILWAAGSGATQDWVDATGVSIYTPS